MQVRAGWRAARNVLGSGIGASMNIGVGRKVSSRIRGGLLGLLAAVIQFCGVGLLLVAGSLAMGTRSSGSHTGGWGSAGARPAGRHRRRRHAAPRTRGARLGGVR